MLFYQAKPRISHVCGFNKSKHPPQLKTPYTTEVLFVLGFYGPVNNEVMSSRSVNSGTVPGQFIFYFGPLRSAIIF